MNSTPNFVDSTTLEGPLENNSTLIKGSVAKDITKVKQQPGKDISISSTLVRSLLHEDLLDEFRLMFHPIIMGSGKRLFEGESAQKALSLVDSRTFGTSVLYLTFQPAQSWRYWRVSGRWGDLRELHHVLELARRGVFDHRVETPQGRLTLIDILGQYSRNASRNLWKTITV